MTEQALPTPNGQPHIVDLVKHDLDDRRLVGITRYGTALQTHNGRDAARDLYEELLDGVQYARQLTTEWAEALAALDKIVDMLTIHRRAGYAGTCCHCGKPAEPWTELGRTCPLHIAREARGDQPAAL